MGDKSFSQKCILFLVIFLLAETFAVEENDSRETKTLQKRNIAEILRAILTAISNVIGGDSGGINPKFSGSIQAIYAPLVAVIFAIAGQAIDSGPARFLARLFRPITFLRQLPRIKIVPPKLTIQPLIIRMIQALLPTFTTGDWTTLTLQYEAVSIPIRLFLALFPFPTGVFDLPRRFQSAFKDERLPQIKIQIADGEYRKLEDVFPLLPTLPTVEIPASIFYAAEALLPRFLKRLKELASRFAITIRPFKYLHIVPSISLGENTEANKTYKFFAVIGTLFVLGLIFVPAVLALLNFLFVEIPLFMYITTLVASIFLPVQIAGGPLLSLVGGGYRLVPLPFPPFAFPILNFPFPLGSLFILKLILLPPFALLKPNFLLPPLNPVFFPFNLFF